MRTIVTSAEFEATLQTERDKGKEKSTSPTLKVVGTSPNVITDKLRKHYDWTVGAEITSKSQRRRLYEDNGMRVKSQTEHIRQHGTTALKGFSASFAGQTDHRSSAEREGVRTKTGQRVV